MRHVGAAYGVLAIRALRHVGESCLQPFITFLVH
jgi:hypothetical protein